MLAHKASATEKCTSVRDFLRKLFPQWELELPTSKPSNSLELLEALRDCFLSLPLPPWEEFLCPFFPFFLSFFLLFLDLCELLFLTECDIKVGIGSYTSGAHFTVSFSRRIPSFSWLPFMEDTSFKGVCEISRCKA